MLKLYDRFSFYFVCCQKPFHNNSYTLDVFRDNVVKLKFPCFMLTKCKSVMKIFIIVK